MLLWEMPAELSMEGESHLPQLSSMLSARDDRYEGMAMVAKDLANEHLHASSSLASPVWSSPTTHAPWKDQRRRAGAAMTDLWLSSAQLLEG